jgi:hypothetical protein
MTDAKEEILDNHRRDLCSFGISTKDEELDLPSTVLTADRIDVNNLERCFLEHYYAVCKNNCVI